MVSADPYQSVEQRLSPLQLLVAATGVSKAACIRLIFALDTKCAEISRSTGEVMIGQMRLAWWRDALTRGEDVGEPLLGALRGSGAFDVLRPHLIAMVDGWEELIVAGEHPGDAELLGFAWGRGGGVFGAIAAAMDKDADQELADAGALWALWDLSGHVRDGALAAKAVALARAQGDVGQAAMPRPLALLSHLARADIARGRAAPSSMTLRLYLRVLRMQILGR